MSEQKPRQIREIHDNLFNNKKGIKPRSDLQHEVSQRNWRLGRILCIQSQIHQLCRELEYNAFIALDVATKLSNANEANYKSKVKAIKQARDNQIK